MQIRGCYVSANVSHCVRTLEGWFTSREDAARSEYGGGCNQCTISSDSESREEHQRCVNGNHGVV